MSDRFEVKITGSNQASQAFQSVTRDMEAMGRTADNTTRRMGMSFEEFNRRAFAIGAAIGSATLALGEFSRAAAEDEAGQQRLQQAIENTGTSYEQYASAVDRAIQVGQDKAFADDQVREALVRLNTVTGDTQASLNQMSLVMDFARARGIDLATAADIVGKVMGGNIGILSRYGFALDANTTSAEALALMQQRVAGQAQVYANSDLGWLDRQRIKFDELTESIGAQADEFSKILMLLPGLSAGYAALAGGIAALGGAPVVAAAALLAGGSYLTYDVIANRNRAGNNTADTVFSNIFAGAADLANFITPGNAFSGIKGQFTGILDANTVEQIIASRMFGFSSEKQVNQLWSGLRERGIVPADVGIADVPDYARSQGKTTDEYITSVLQAGGYVYDSNTGLYFTQGDFRRRTAVMGMELGGPQAGLSYGGAGMGGTTPYFPFREGANPQADAALYSAERQRILAQIDQAALDFISNPGNVSQLLNNWQVMPDAPVFNRRAGGGTGGSTTPFYAAASAAGTARDQFETGYRVTIGQTQQIASQSQGLASFAEDLVNYEGVIGRVDDLLNRGVISIDAYRTAQEDANQIFAANADIQDDVASIQVKQLGYNAEMLSQYAETIDAIEQMGEAEQRRALAMMDSGEAAKVNEAATIAYRVAMGELSETIGTDLIEGMARADPLLADLLEQYGLIEQGADGEIRVIFPEKENLTDAIADLSDEIRALVDAIYEITIYSNAPAVSSDLDGVANRLNYLNGKSATFYVNEVRTGISIGNPSGPGFEELAHGGVVGYANGGVVARMAEAGPELLRFRDGGTAWAMQDGLYNVPRGTYVTPAPASKGQGRSAPSIVIQNLNLYSNDPRDMVRQINEYARGGSRL